MIVDSSALIAILRDEPDEKRFSLAIATAEARRMSAANYVEVGAVIDAARDPIASRRFDDFLALTRIEIAPAAETQAKVAREAYRDFGMGTGHPAKLNFGDCFAYALAKERGEPLLFKGNDFKHTGVDAA